MKASTVIPMIQYNFEQAELLKGHEIENIYTSPFQDNRYTKHYICTDGFELWEVNRIIYEKREIKINVYGLEVFKIVEIQLYEHEMWTSKTASVFAYEYLK